MTGARRARLTPRAATEHVGLLIDRYIEDKTTLADSFNRAAQAVVPPVYRHRFRRWEAALAELGRADGADPRFLARAHVETQGRLVVGIGAESVHEVALALQWLDGAPVIPSSALKGLTAHYTHRQADLGEEYRKVLFGTTGAAAYLTWLDAWYVPGSAPGDRPLVHDIMTVHHPRYYGSRGRERAPWDLDDPNPLPFLSVRGCFLVGVLGPSQAWAEFGLRVLTQALTDWGVGAKTSSGYGRFSMVASQPAAAPLETSEPVAATREHPLIAQLRATPSNRLRQEIGGIVDRIEKLPEAEREPVLAALAETLRATNQWSWAQGRSWFTRLGLADRGD